MAIRVDDIAVTDKNVLLLSGGRQFVADIERNTDALDSGNYTRDRNPWNFYSSDGRMYHNLFDTAEFDVRTQVLTGSTRHSPNNSRSHECIFMPHDTGYVGMCQFYGNAYSVTENTTSTLTSYIVSGGCEESVGCEHGFIRYDNLSAYDNPSKYYISPEVLFTPDCGVQYLTEYPIGGFYTDFGDNESTTKPTLFGDSVLSKYYLDCDYSVSSYDVVDGNRVKFKQIRTYYDVGSTGNSIYMVFRNNLYGDANVDAAGGDVGGGHASVTISAPLSSVGFMSNMTTLLDIADEHATRGFYYSSGPYSDMFAFSAMSSLSSGLCGIRHPLDDSFILYINAVDGGTNLTYVPKIGLERSAYTLNVSEPPTGFSIVELPHCIAIGTRANGLLTVWSRDYLYNGGDTLVNFYPFQHACTGVPSASSLTSGMDASIYRDISLYYNGVDILGARATVCNELSAYSAKVAFFSTNYDDGNRTYDIGQFFMPAGNPLYEIETVTSYEEARTPMLSSVPVSSITENGDVNWNFELKMVDVVTGLSAVTSEPFQLSSNYVSDSDILFDYSSTDIEGELQTGSYAFVQFEKYGLSKCYVGDIYSTGGMVKFSSTGPVNRYDSRKKKWNAVDGYFQFSAQETGETGTLRGKANSFDDLKHYGTDGNGVLLDKDVMSLVEEHTYSGYNTSPYTCFAYVVDGNTSSWVPTSLPYLKGYVGDFNTLSMLTGVEESDSYLVAKSHTYAGVDTPSSSFYSYHVSGNLRYWKPEGGVVTAKVDTLSEFPDVGEAYASELQVGDMCLLCKSATSPQISNADFSFYIYNRDKRSYVKKWSVLGNNDLATMGLKNSIGNPIEGTTFRGVLKCEEVENFEPGWFAIVSDSGTIGGVDFAAGSVCFRDNNGWANVTNVLFFGGHNDWTYGDGVPYHYYIYDDFTSLAHMSEPQALSIFIVRSPYIVDTVTYPQYTYFVYGSNGNEWGWWPSSISPEGVKGRVGSYADLSTIGGVVAGDVYLVTNAHKSDTVALSAADIYTYSQHGNVSEWTSTSSLSIPGNNYNRRDYTEPFGKIRGNVSNYAGLYGIGELSDSDVFIVCTEHSENGYHTPPHSFYQYKRYDNTANWRTVAPSASMMISGYVESFDELECLSGDIGSMYFTESSAEPLTFYRMEENEAYKVCTDATFATISYGDDSRKPILEAIDYVTSDYGTYYVTAKPALKATFRLKNPNYYANSFSYLPLTERDGIQEPTFSTVKSLSAETTPLSTFAFALEKPVPNSMCVAARTFKGRGVNHDAAIVLVGWNNPNGLFPYGSRIDSGEVSGLFLQYSGICTDVYMNGSVLSSKDADTGEARQVYSSTVYEYPHACYGELRTVGTGLPIFEGPLGDATTLDDLFFVNGYFVVKNYSTKVLPGKTDEEWGSLKVGSGKHPNHDTGKYPGGGYVVTNFFADTGRGSGIPYLYTSKLVESSRETPKTKADSERFFDYNFLWQITPSKPIEFYPESQPGKVWTPYYPLKYVDFIRYHNGYYYISLRSQRDKAGAVGYDVIETDTLFTEKELKKLPSGTIVSDIGFFGNHVAVEYEMWNGGICVDRYIKWFDCGKSGYKVMPTLEGGAAAEGDDILRSSTLTTFEDRSPSVAALYDNVEVLNSLNRFTPVVNHKSNLFSIRIDDLGFEESEYLTDYQKGILRSYFRNNISEIVNAVKPAHTQMFDVYFS